MDYNLYIIYNTIRSLYPWSSELCKKREHDGDILTGCHRMWYTCSWESSHYGNSFGLPRTILWRRATRTSCEGLDVWQFISWCVCVWLQVCVGGEGGSLQLMKGCLKKKKIANVFVFLRLSPLPPTPHPLPPHPPPPKPPSLLAN